MNNLLSLSDFLLFLLISAVVLPLFVAALFAPSIWDWLKKRTRG